MHKLSSWHPYAKLALSGVSIQYRIDRHDRSQLEFKLRYPLASGSDKQAYRVQTFVFVPRELMLTKQSYTKDRFYADSSTYLRVTTPRLGLESLSEKSAIKPWAKQIKRSIEEVRTEGYGQLAEAEQNLKLLGCIFQAALRDSRERLLSE